MEESSSKNGSQEMGVSKKRKVLCPWKFQSGYKRWPNGFKSRKTSNGKNFEFVEDLGDLNGETEKRENLGNVRNSDDSKGGNGETLNNANDLGGETSNHVKEKSDLLNDLDGLSTKLEDLSGLNNKFENGENSNNSKDFNGLNGCTNNNKKNQIVSKNHKALVPWRFQIGYKRAFKEEILKTNTRKSPYPQRKYPSSVRVSASREFSPTLRTDLKNGFSKLGQCSNFEKNKAVSIRDNLVANLRKFQCIYRELISKEAEKMGPNGLDLIAFKRFRERNNSFEETKKYVGTVPGTKVGDIFQLRVELCVVGLHTQIRSCVDFIKQEDENLAISVVSYGNSLDLKKKIKIDSIEFVGSSVATGDLKIEGSNLALIKSMETKIPIRFIYGFMTKSPNPKPRKLSTYIYCGLYNVEKYWKKKSDDDKSYVYMFRLKRVAGQPDFDINEILESRKMETFLFPAFYLEDISLGQEKIPISVVNYIDDEKPPFYSYITVLKPTFQTHLGQNQNPKSITCNCLKGCNESDPCNCITKNGGEIPFNNKGLIIEAKPLVFECGPFCKCPPTCLNRVSQNGMKFKLQIFKTEKMGWGVRSLNFIPSGSFVCEYIGELLNDEEAQKRDNDEYLFSIGNNYFDEKLWEGLKTSIPALQKSKNHEMESFAIDASKYGNFARFINHSCEPNMYAQNLLFDHDNLSTPHIMFFACEDIQPMEELTYHYNYCVDQVHDINGNIKKKRCFCGTGECTGWLY
ncbi:hypothetical protein LUZ60_016891 [Juncus effusus]|nr:hypothetical protein LUZ60_016891 [Juncus effusus]